MIIAFAAEPTLCFHKSYSTKVTRMIVLLKTRRGALLITTIYYFKPIGLTKGIGNMNREVPAVKVSSKVLVNLDILLEKLSCGCYNDDTTCA